MHLARITLKACLLAYDCYQIDHFFSELSVRLSYDGYIYRTTASKSSAAADADIIKVTCIDGDRNNKTGIVWQILDL